MSITTLASPETPSRSQTASGAGLLALALQEAFTAAMRLRANRQVAADADSFRTHVKQLLAAADHEARRAGYAGEHVKLAIYAYVALLDESVLNSHQPMFAAWPRQPLQEEIFGDHIAGETFFRYLEELLGAQDSPEIADVLEVFQLCMLLGFRGRYALGDGAGLQSRVAAAGQKIARIRGAVGELSPAWALPSGETPPATRDPWLRRLGAGAGVSFLVAASLYLGFRLSLAGEVGALRELVTTLTR